jgi:hypothetical protein
MILNHEANSLLTRSSRILEERKNESPNAIGVSVKNVQ